MPTIKHNDYWSGKLTGYSCFMMYPLKELLRRAAFMCLITFCPIVCISAQDYFQQEVNYKIEVTLNDQKHELNGYESVEYKNNSPDTLRFLYFHLWPNAYSANSTQLAREISGVRGKGKLFNDPELSGSIDSIDFESEGNDLRWNLLEGNPDICKVILINCLLPGGKIIINTPFHVKIPKGVTSRLGHIGESYQISQWYPKPAVYDKTGWHQMPYMDEAEFYSEYGSFDVSITLPANYTVGASGNLQNEDELLRLDALAADNSWLKRPYSDKPGYPESSDKMKTLRYTEKNIHDFAWFADKRFHVLKGMVKLPDSGREVTTWAMFTDQEKLLWIDAVSYINNAILYFSKCIGDYPYNSFTAVQSALNSGAGMEYPGLTVIGLARDPYLLDEVIAHEICHSWFYSAIGSDERRFPFMDESIASAYESRYLENRYPGKKLWEISVRKRKVARFFHIEDMPVQRIAELGWLVPARKNEEQPVNLAATDYSYLNYGSIIYNKAGQGFNYLRAYLSDSTYDAIMHNYYSKWKNRHPSPDDLRDIFESGTDKELSWFFDDFLGTTGRIDYKIVRREKDSLLIRNKGNINAPLLLAGIKKDTVFSAKWEDGFEGSKWFSTDREKYSAVKIDPGHKMTEIYRLDNNIRTSGIFRKADPVQIQLLYTVEDPDKRYLIYFPAFDWNSADGFMAGVALHNGTLLPKPVEYLFIPFYSFSNSGLTGYGKISFNEYPYNHFIRHVKFTIEGSQFGSPGNQKYQSTRMGLELNFTHHKMINPVMQKLSGYYLAASDLSRIILQSKAKLLSYMQFGYSLERKGKVNPFSMAASLEAGRQFQKASLDLNYKYSYYGANNGLEIRIFAGTMFKNNASEGFYALSPGGRGGREQYLYQGVYPDRFSLFPKTLWSRQMAIAEGGLVSPVNDSLGYSQWLVSFTLTSSLPGKASRIPIRPFVNILLNDHVSSSDNKIPLFFEAGLKAGIWNLLEIYIPIVISDNIREITGSFKERIRFIFRIDMFSPHSSKI